MAARIQPQHPDPGVYGSRFIAWLLRQGGLAPLSRAKRKWTEEGLDVEMFVAAMGKEQIERLYDPRSGEDVFHLCNIAWAVAWMHRYGDALPQKRSVDGA
jgi:hypothetical protein